MDNPDISFVVVKGVKPSFQKGYIFSNRSILFNGDLAFADRKAQDYFIEKEETGFSVGSWIQQKTPCHYKIDFDNSIYLTPAPCG